MHAEKQTEKNQPEQDVSPSVCPDREEVAETDTSPAKTLKFLQRVRAKEQGCCIGAIDLTEGSSCNDDELGVGEYCAKKLQSFNGSDLIRLVGLIDELVSIILGAERLPEDVACVAIGFKDMIGVSHDVNNSTPLKQIELAKQGFLPVDTPPVRTLVKRVAIVALKLDESSQNFGATSQLTNFVRSDFGPRDRIAKSVEEVH